MTKTSEIWDIIQSDPSILKSIESYQADHWDDEQGRERNESKLFSSYSNQLFIDLQMRLYFGNGLLTDPRYSKILKYWKNDIPAAQEAEYKSNVKEMAALLLKHYREHPPEFDITLVNKDIPAMVDKFLAAYKVQ